MKNLVKEKLKILYKMVFLFLFVFGLSFFPADFSKTSLFNAKVTFAKEDEKARNCRLDCYTKHMLSGLKDASAFKTCSDSCGRDYKARESGNDDISGMETALKGLIHYVFVIPMAWFAALGANIAGILLDPIILNSIFSDATTDTALYEMWTFVRDILNLLFIFILLFSAFATVFQIQKYHLLKSNTLIMIIFMAILVNFSWPITRVIMDAGNVTMFYLLDALVLAPPDAPKGEYLFGLLTDGTGIIRMIALDGDDQQAAYDKARVTDQIAAGIFLMLFAITFLAIAAIFLIRIVAFIILLIFSPVGFVAAIFPGTAKFSNMWWEALLKWTFIGPLMVFMVYISTTFIIQMNHLAKNINGFGVSDNSLVVNGIIYSSGIVMLWSGILVAQEMGGAAGSFIASKAKSARGTSFRLWKWGAGSAAGVAYIAGRATARVADNKTGNWGARIAGHTSGFLQSSKRELYSDPKNKYEREKSLAVAKAQGRDVKVQADKEDQEKYKNDLNAKSIDTVMKKAEIGNKNENERRAAREVLMEKDKIKSETDLIKALSVLSNDTKDTENLLKNASEHIFDDSNMDTYKDLIKIINDSVPTTGDPSIITAARSKADKQLKQIEKQFVNKNRADIVYNYQVANGTDSKTALKNATKGLTAEQMAKQNKLLQQASSNTLDGDVIKAHIKTEFVKHPVLRQELLKNLSPAGLSMLKTTILDQERTENNLTKVDNEIIMIERQLKTLNYANKSSWTTAETERETKLNQRKTDLESRKRIIERSL